MTKTLSLNIDKLSDEAVKKISDIEQQQIDLKKAENIRKEQDIIEQKKERTQQALKFLQLRFNKCFNYKDPLPLKVKIIHDIFNDASVAEKIKLGDFSKTNVNDALKVYTHSKRYNKAIISNDSRIDLNGNTVGEVEKKHKDFAHKILAMMADRNNNKKSK